MKVCLMLPFTYINVCGSQLRISAYNEYSEGRS
jgi:hypothetical protein